MDHSPATEPGLLEDVSAVPSPLAADGRCDTGSAPRGRRPSPPDNQAAVSLLNRHGARLEYTADFLSPAEESQFRHQLEREVVFDSAEASRVFVHGRWHDIPRRQCAHGDDDCPGYRFSGVQVRPRGWIEPLRALRDLVAERTGFRANFVLVNHYAHAGQHISWHADDERDLDPAAPIASLLLGSARDFQFRPCARGAEPGTVTLTLETGSLLMMHPPTNTLFQHCLPKRSGARAAAIGARWNLTFRRMIAAPLFRSPIPDQRSIASIGPNKDLSVDCKWQRLTIPAI